MGHQRISNAVLICVSVLFAFVTDGVASLSRTAGESAAASPGFPSAISCTATVPDLALVNVPVSFAGAREILPPAGGELVGPDPIVGNLRYIPAGTFLQGAPPDEFCRSPYDGVETQFSHTLTKPFALMEMEVSREMWSALRAVQGALPADPSEPHASASQRHPVQSVTWAQALLFANLLSVQNGLEVCYFVDEDLRTPLDGSNYQTTSVWAKNPPVFCRWSASGYRLPSEGEWEYACRAGTTTPFFFPSPDYSAETCVNNLCPITWANLRAVAFIDGNDSWSAAEVGSREKANPWNLRDILGNVKEMCWDHEITNGWIYGAYPLGPQTDYRGRFFCPEGQPCQRACRGMGWSNDVGIRSYRSAFRCGSLRDETDASDPRIGFRLCRTLPAALRLPASPTATWDWDFGDGSAHGNTQETTHAYQTPGTYAWTLRVSEGADVCETSGSIVVLETCEAPAITAEPSAAAVCSGWAATLSLTATGTGLSYQWYQGARGDTAAPVGGDAPSLTTPPLSAAALFWCRVTGLCGSADSAEAAVNIRESVEVLTQPVDAWIAAGQTATLTVLARGEGLSYQWYQGTAGTVSAPVGDDSPSFTTAALTESTSYWCRVQGTCGVADTRTATVSIAPVPTVVLALPNNEAEKPEVAGKVPVSVQVVSGSGAVVLADRQAAADGSPIPLEGGSSASFRFFWDVTGLGLGEHTLCVSVVDGYGQSASAERTVRVCPAVLGSVQWKWNGAQTPFRPAAGSLRAVFRLADNPAFELGVSEAGTFDSRTSFVDAAHGEAEFPWGTTVPGTLEIEYDDHVSPAAGAAPVPVRRVMRLLAPCLLDGGTPLRLNLVLGPPLFLVNGVEESETCWDVWRERLLSGEALSVGFLVFSPLNPGLWLEENATLPGLYQDSKAPWLQVQVEADLTGLFGTGPQSPFTLVCHGEGGVSARFLLQRWAEENSPFLAGAAKVFTLGTPHSGTDHTAWSLYGLGREAVINLNAICPDFGPADVFAVSGHEGCAEGFMGPDDGRVFWLSDTVRSNESPFLVRSPKKTAAGSLSGDYVETAFANDNEAPLRCNGTYAHNFPFSHQELTSAEAFDALFGGAIAEELLDAMEGATVQRRSAGPVSAANGGAGVPRMASAHMPVRVMREQSWGVGGSWTVPVASAEKVWFDAAAAGLRPRITLVDPNGVLVTPEGVSGYGGAAYRQEGPYGAGYTVTSPTGGNWTLSVEAADATGAVFATCSETGGWMLCGGTDYPDYRPAEAIQFLAWPVGEFSAVTAGLVKVSVRNSLGAEVFAADMADDGLHGDGVAGDELFGAGHAAPPGQGFYTAEYWIEAQQGGQTVRRQGSSGFNVLQEERILTGTYDDRAEDVDGDGKSDRIVVECGLLVPRAGNYSVSAELRDAAGYRVGSGSGSLTADSPGEARSNVVFDLRTVGCDAFSGPFALHGVRVVSARGVEDVQEEAGQTHAYAAEQFACAPGKPAPGPLVTGIQPRSAYPGQSLDVSLDGRFFQPGASLQLGEGIAVKAQERVDEYTFRARLDIAWGTSPAVYSPRVSNPDGKAGSLAAGFSVLRLAADLNADGYVDASDAELLGGFLAGDLAALPCSDCADLNDDGSVDLLDLVLLVARIP